MKYTDNFPRSFHKIFLAKEKPKYTSIHLNDFPKKITPKQQYMCAKSFIWIVWAKK